MPRLGSVRGAKSGLNQLGQKLAKSKELDELALQSQPICFYKLIDDNNYLEQREPQNSYNQNFEKIVKTFQQSAKEYNWVGIAPQNVYCHQNLFLITKGIRHIQEWEHPLCSENEYDIYINPSIESVGNKSSIGEEISQSSPGFLCKIKRWDEITVKYLNKKMDYCYKDLEGFEARVFQHFFDQIKGRNILDWRINLGNFEVDKDGRDHLRKSIRARTKQVEEARYFFEEYREFSQMRNLQQLNQNHDYIYSYKLDEFFNDFDHMLVDNFNKALDEDWKHLIKKYEGM